MTIESREIYAIKTQIADLKDRASELSLAKRKLETELQTLSNRVRKSSGLLPGNEYKNICSRQIIVKKNILEIENKIAPIKSELRRWYAMEDEARVKANLSFTDNRSAPVTGNAGDKEDKFRHRIIELRNEYLNFSEDSTRINSMRLMSSQIANELTAALKDV
jgi:hypothetical protein